MTISLIACFILAIVLAGVLLVAFIFIMNSGGRDAVSPAREDWIQRRSEKDKNEW